MAEAFRIEYMWQYRVLKKHLEEMQAQVQTERSEEESQRLSEIESAVRLFEQTVLKKHADADADGNGSGEREEGGEGDGSGG